MPVPEAPHDPRGVLEWITAIIETFHQAYVAILIPIGGSALWWLKRSDERRSKAQQRADDKQRLEEEGHQKIADALDGERAERFAELRQEVLTLRTAVMAKDAVIAAKDAEISRLLIIVRKWFDLAHDMRHEAGRLLQRLFTLMQKGGLTPPSVQMPDLSYDPERP